MQILCLSQLVPYPLDAGPKVRTYYALRQLAADGHQLTLVAFRRESDSAAAISHLEQFCAAVHTVLMHRQPVRAVLKSLHDGTPLLITRDSVPAMHDLLRQLVTQTKFDAIHADQTWMAQYALPLKSQATKLVLDQHNATFQITRRMADNARLPIRWLLRRETRLMERYERAVCATFNDVVWVTETDRTAFEPPLHGKVIPIGVDTSHSQVERSNPFRITFLGGMHWPPNAEGVNWFLQTCWPRIRAALPDHRLTLIGKEPPIATQDGIDALGYVEDVQPYLRETAVFIVPLRSGGGMRVKILDAWRWGLPVVSTTVGAEGIVGEGIWLRDDSAEFAQAIIQLAKNRDQADALATQGYQTVCDQYDWRKLYEKWRAIYPPVLRQNAPVQSTVSMGSTI